MASSDCSGRDFLKSILETIRSETPDLDCFETSLGVLRSFECWVPFNKLVRFKMEKLGPKIEDFCWLISAQVNFIEDFKEASKLSLEMVQTLEIDYQLFRREVIDKILLDENFELEANLLRSSYTAFQDGHDQVACLERLCFIYEKKMYEADLLSGSFHSLIELDPQNVKALRHFKGIHLHQRDYTSVVQILERLYHALPQTMDKSRVAMEWASTCLYQLNDAQRTIQVLEKVSSNSLIDTSTLRFESHYQLKNWEDCQKILSECLADADLDRHRAVLLFKIGEIKELLSADEEAKKMYEDSFSMDKSFLEPIENLIDICVKTDDWVSALKYIKKLANEVEDIALKGELENLVERIDDGLENAV